MEKFNQNSLLSDTYYSLLNPPPADLIPLPACGFMDLLGYPTFEGFSPSFLDGIMSDDHNNMLTLSNAESHVTSSCSPGILEASTPNSSSFSSASNDNELAPLDDSFCKSHVKDEDGLFLDQEDHQQNPNTTCPKLPLKPKKTNQKKKQKEARFAFMTKSEVDHLEDGYRWRKYGQKAVKNSPFPRSYYRCTSTSCNVKKRVERCFNDPSIVITTYEGQHTHPSPIMARSLGFPVMTGFSTGPTTGPCSLPAQIGSCSSTLSSYNNLLGHNNYVNFNQISRRFCNPSSDGVGNGLLRDIVPSDVYEGN